MLKELLFKKSNYIKIDFLVTIIELLSLINRTENYHLARTIQLTMKVSICDIITRPNYRKSSFKKGVDKVNLKG